MSSDKPSLDHLNTNLRELSVMDTDKSADPAGAGPSRFSTAKLLEQKVQEIVEEQDQPSGAWGDQVSDTEISSTLENLKFLEGLSYDNSNLSVTDSIDTGNPVTALETHQGGGETSNISGLKRLHSPNYVGGKVHTILKNGGKLSSPLEINNDSQNWPNGDESWSPPPTQESKRRREEGPVLEETVQPPSPTPSLLRKIIQTTHDLFENNGLFEQKGKSGKHPKTPDNPASQKNVRWDANQNPTTLARAETATRDVTKVGHSSTNKNNGGGANRPRGEPHPMGTIGGPRHQIRVKTLPINRGLGQTPPHPLRDMEGPDLLTERERGQTPRRLTTRGDRGGGGPMTPLQPEALRMHTITKQGTTPCIHAVETPPKHPHTLPQNLIFHPKMHPRLRTRTRGAGGTM